MTFYDLTTFYENFMMLTHQENKLLTLKMNFDVISILNAFIYMKIFANTSFHDLK